jgi:hypothetical protein
MIDARRDPRGGGKAVMAADLAMGNSNAEAPAKGAHAQRTRERVVRYSICAASG